MARVFYVARDGGWIPTEDPGDVFELEPEDYVTFEFGRGPDKCFDWGSLQEVRRHFQDRNLDSGVILFEEVCRYVRSCGFEPGRWTYGGRVEALPCFIHRDYPFIAPWAVIYAHKELSGMGRYWAVEYHPDTPPGAHNHVDRTALISRQRLQDLCEEYGAVGCSYSQRDTRLLNALAEDGFVLGRREGSHCERRCQQTVLRYNPAKAQVRLTRQRKKAEQERAKVEAAKARDEAEVNRLRAGRLTNKELRFLINDICASVVEGVAQALGGDDHYRSHHLAEVPSFRRLQRAQILWNGIRHQPGVGPEVLKAVSRWSYLGYRISRAEVPKIVRRVAGRWSGEPRRLLLFAARLIRTANSEIPDPPSEDDE